MQGDFTMLNKKRIKCDLCVVGGGMSGMAAAISAGLQLKY